MYPKSLLKVLVFALALSLMLVMGCDKSEEKPAEEAAATEAPAAATEAPAAATEAPAAEAPAEGPIKIGAVFSATGGASFLGMPEKETVFMLAEELNANGGLLGRQVEVVFYDDKTEPDSSALAMDKLIKKDQVVAVVGPSTSGFTLNNMAKFSDAEIPLVSCAAAEKIVKPVNPWVFKTPQSDRLAVEKILQHAAGAGYTKVAILTATDGFGQAGQEVLEELVPAQGMELVANEKYDSADTDMTAQLTKIGGLEADCIVVWGTKDAPAVIARNRQQLGMTIPMYMSHGVASKTFIEQSQGAAEGIMLPAGRLIVAGQIADDNPQKQLLLDYTAKYEARTDSPVSTFGGHAWDAFNLVVTAIENGGSAAPADIRDNLEKIQNFSGTGGIFNFSAEDHNGLTADAFVMVVIENGDWKVVE